MPPPDGPQIIKPPNLLKSKVGSGGGKIDSKAIERAQNVITSNQGQFEKWVAGSIGKIDEVLQRVKTGEAVDEAAKTALFDAAFDIKSSSGTFDFPIISAIAENLYRFIESHQYFDDKTIEVIGLHLAGIKTVLAKKIKGKGGQSEAELIGSLRELAMKNLASHGLVMKT